MSFERLDRVNVMFPFYLSERDLGWMDCWIGGWRDEPIAVKKGLRLYDKGVSPGAGRYASLYQDRVEVVTNDCQDLLLGEGRVFPSTQGRPTKYKVMAKSPPLHLDHHVYPGFPSRTAVMSRSEFTQQPWSRTVLLTRVQALAGRALIASSTLGIGFYLWLL